MSGVNKSNVPGFSVQVSVFGPEGQSVGLEANEMKAATERIELLEMTYTFLKPDTRHLNTFCGVTPETRHLKPVFS